MNVFAENPLYSVLTLTSKSMPSIQPILTESEWQLALNEYPCWQPECRETYIITPHPDDETLGAGGLIADMLQRGIDVTVITVTDGEHAYAGESGLGEIRKNEQEHALRVLGLAPHKIIRLHLIDSAVASSEQQLEHYLLSIIQHPVNIFATWYGDFHPDHEAVGRVAERVALQTTSALIFYFFWTWHRGTMETLKDFPLKRYLLTPELQALKQAAIQCYTSQMVYPGHEPILTKALLLPTLRPYEIYLPL